MEIMSTSSYGYLIFGIAFVIFHIVLRSYLVISEIKNEGATIKTDFGFLLIGALVGLVACMCITKDNYIQNKVKVTDPVYIEECIRCGNIEVMKIDDGCMYAEMSTAQLKKVKDNVNQKSMYASLQGEKEQGQGEQQHSR